MTSKFIFFAANPFLDAYVLSDLFGKGIFVSLIILSVWSWTLLVQKALEVYKVKKSGREFLKDYEENSSMPLALEAVKGISSGPFQDVYMQAKRTALELVDRNSGVSKGSQSLTISDITIIEAHIDKVLVQVMQKLEKNLYLLSMIVSLAPFVGLLGTVWGILMTFSELNNHASGGMHQAVLGGLSLALVTTVLGLLDAIPALIGYSYFKNDLKSFGSDMEGFATDLISKIEIQYCK